MSRSRVGAAVLAGLLMLMAPAALAQTDETTTTTAPSALTVITPYPSVAVEPGDQVSFDLTVAAPDRSDVALSAEGLPEGWNGTFTGGGFEIGSVTAGPGLQPEVSFDVSVPVDAEEGSYPVTLRADSGSDLVEVPLEIRVSVEAGGEVTLTPDFPGLRAPAGETVTFDVELNNGTPSDLQLELAASGPAGWDVTAQPSGEEQASTIQVEAGSSATVTVEATSPVQAEAGQFPIAVQATGGDTQVEAEMVVEVVGSFSMDLTTADQRLNAEVSVGSSSQRDLVVTNTGTAPLQGIELSATPPSGWEVTFEQPVIPAVEPGESVVATATITPSEEAVAGDYLIGFSASHQDANAEIEIRTNVSPSPVWGFVGIAVIALTLAGLAWIFRRFGRR